MSKGKVIFLYASLNSGHQRAAHAIKEALLKDDPEIETMDIEALNFSYPAIGKKLHEIYMIMATNLSRFYDFLWDNVTIERRITKLKEIVNKGSLNKFEDLFSMFPAKAAVCTQALPCGFLSMLKEKRGFSFKLLAVVTDYDVHAYWIYDQVDFFCVGTAAMRDKLLKRGVSDEKIKVIGIPVSSQFYPSINKDFWKEELGIRKDLPCVLVMGGSYGVGPLKEIIMSLDQVKVDFSMLVVAGKNKKLHKTIEKLSKKSKKTIKLFGYTSHISQLMQAGDILITKPGGLTVSEALCVGLPMIINKGVMGQESGNFKYLIENGAAVSGDGPADIGRILEKIIRDESALAVMRNNALKIAKPKAASEISQIVRSFL